MHAIISVILRASTGESSRRVIRGILGSRR
jgi:hypothetical protein